MNTSLVNTVFGITKDTYDMILSLGVLAVLAFVILHIIAYISSRAVRAKTLQFGYFTYIKIIGIFSVLATIFALTYQYGYGLPVCELCWWQRIFMFPIDFIVIMAIASKIAKIHKPIMALSVVGMGIAAYHYSMNIERILGKTNSLMGTSCGGGVDCTDTAGVAVFNFITIPFMALVIFILITWLAFLAGHKAKQNAQ